MDVTARFPTTTNSQLRLGALAGIAGGTAEVAWILIYSGLGDSKAADIARGVTATFSTGLADSAASVVVGISIHMTIALALGIALAVAVDMLVPRSESELLKPCIVILALVAVWAVNFQVLLPLINPSFVEFFPLGVGLASKVAFGAAAALVFHFGSEPSGYSGNL